jgi:3-isopropylmalate/(R)-2-methylmalate dehydratase small subunit
MCAAGAFQTEELMEPLRIHSGIVAPLDRADVDTDQIIPKQFLKRIERTGYGQFLFYDWRHRPGGRTEPDFVLNSAPYDRASVLVAGRNFGCGSSREHAAWALRDFGFRVIIAPSFANIFATNCAKNGLALIALGDQQVAQLMQLAQRRVPYRLTVTLESRTISDDHGLSITFAMDDFRRHCLMDGLDDISLTLQHRAHIERYESSRHDWLPAAPPFSR